MKVSFLRAAGGSEVLSFPALLGIAMPLVGRSALLPFGPFVVDRRVRNYEGISPPEGVR